MIRLNYVFLLAYNLVLASPQQHLANSILSLPLLLSKVQGVVLALTDNNPSGSDIQFAQKVKVGVSCVLYLR